MSFAIDSIWIEYEFVVPDGINDCLETALKVLRKVNDENPKFTITLDREYYSDQIEFKLMRTTHIDEGIAYFQKVMIDMYKEIKPLSSTTKKHFVGTHIHLFLNKDWVPYTKFAQWKKVLLVKYAYTKMADFLTKLNKEGNVLRRVVANEMMRLTTNHNILRYFDNSIWNKLKSNLESLRMQYQQFHSWTDRPKYTPVLWSLANEASGKPHSLEIRCIPNTFLMLSKPTEISEYVMGVADVLNTRATKTVEEAANEIASTHLSLLTQLIRID